MEAAGVVPRGAYTPDQREDEPGFYQLWDMTQLFRGYLFDALGTKGTALGYAGGSSGKPKWAHHVVYFPTAHWMGWAHELWGVNPVPLGSWRWDSQALCGQAGRAEGKGDQACSPTFWAVPLWGGKAGRSTRGASGDSWSGCCWLRQSLPSLWIE